MSRRNEFSHIIGGIVLVLGMHILATLILGTFAYLESLLAYQYPIRIFQQIFAIYIFWIGITQVIYIIPVLLRLKRQEKFALMKGVIIGAIFTALLNGGCWIWLINLTS
ncbi:hypothetical protein NIES592_13090 [Fischerella major NIES-592]|uniref:Uncharacterized protein n=1 Tax=Fischerella major NIES-592 TaxID=210994 RepID=A0A1U7GYN5_9CYAN|nr:MULTISPECIES: hypothetical protein [Fischerella]OKH13562.1 hypothetical protein NIES592_13090 [Fischerella major NIES-592]BAU06939.1 hypothetical protein FIS3754_28620 [Fischerella sp. NIES-3754]BCX09256.1 MAG: hypothetical protein KatS3mg066_3115 [Fischerella sp.]